MIKIKTLFKKVYGLDGGYHVIDEIEKGNEWVYHCGIATRKFNGMATAIINGELYRRYDNKKNKILPTNSIECQPRDFVTGHWPFWVKCERTNQQDKLLFDIFDKMDEKKRRHL